MQTRTRSLTQRTQSLKSRTLNIANAELVAANSERTFSEEYDRLGAIDGLLNTPLYQEDSSALLPSARRFLNKALYNYSAIDMPKLQHVLDTESMTEDFSFSPDRRSIVAYDARNTYVFDVATGELIYKAHEDSMIEAAFSDNEHIFVNTGFDIKNIAFADGTVAWSKPAYEYAPDTDAFFGNLRFSKDFKRAALFDSSGYFLFLDTATGEVLYKINLSLGTSGFFFTNQCTDFSDGVHFTTVYYNEYGDSSNSWNICLDIENHTFTKVYNNRGSSILATRYVDNRTIASVENNNYLNPNDPEYGKTFINFIGLGGDVVRKVALDEYTISNVQIRAVFTTKDTDTPQTFVALSGITFTDKLPTVFFVNVTTGELIVRNLPSAVTQIGYRGTSGWVSVYTSQGAQYHYNILTDYSILGNVLTDSSVFSADGSRKLVWVSNNLSAALGKQSNRIMVYFSEESQAASTIPGDGNGFSRVTEGNDCIYSVSKTKLFVHDKNTKKERFRFNIDYSMGPSVVCRDSLYVLDNDADYIHIYNGENGEEYYINISGLSRYSVHYQHHTKI